RADAEGEVVVRGRRDAFELPLAGVEIDRRDGRLMDGDVVLAVHEIADRVPDAALVEQSRRELVKQRLERVVVVSVDEHDVCVGVFQLLRGADPGEASAENDHAWTSRLPGSQETSMRLPTLADITLVG